METAVSIENNSTTRDRNASNMKQSWNEMIEFNRYGIISMALIIVGCYGGVVVWSGAVEILWQLVAVVIPTMTTLSLLLAVAPMKHIVRWSVIALIVDTLILAINLLM
jgi:hypothetical protein